MKLGAIIAAGGIGSRMGTGSSKQLMLLGGQPVVARSAAIFEAAPEVEEMVIVIDASDIERCRTEVVDEFGLHKVRAVVAGGENRAMSVRSGLSQLGEEIDTVLIHDGARPLFPPGLLAGGLSDFAVGDCDGVVFGLPVTDTIKEVGAGNRFVAHTPDRSRLWAAQTPQIFKRQALEKSYNVSPQTLAASTDDAALIEGAGGGIKMTMGSPSNIKITTPLDIIVAEEILKQRGNS